MKQNLFEEKNKLLDTKQRLLILVSISIISLVIVLSIFLLKKAKPKVLCGGWDLVNGEIICECQGRYEKDTCPEGALCDSVDYYCYGKCGSCHQVVKRKTNEGERSAETGEGNQIVAVTTAPPALSSYPDYPLDSVPTTPISTKFLVEHRSGLNGKVVKVRGVIVDYNFETTVPCEGDTCPLIARRTGVTIADSLDEGRDKNYDLFVPLDPVNKGKYFVGQTVFFNVRVYGNKDYLSLVKID